VLDLPNIFKSVLDHKFKIVITYLADLVKYELELLFLTAPPNSVKLI